MTHKQLSQFTYEELSSLTYGDLTLEPTKLLSKMVEEYGSNDIPQSVFIKLQKICYSLEDVCKENNIEFPTQTKIIETKSKISKTEILSVIANILTIIQVFLSMNNPSGQDITIINNNYYGDTYITNEYIDDIKNIIEDLKQATDIHIDTIEDATDTGVEENIQNKI